MFSYRNPLLQFAVIGLVLFGFWHWQNKDFAGEDITISADQIQKIANQYERTFLRRPNADELQALIQDEVRSELAYREAKRLGLDKDDTIIKRRMRQKIEFLAEELSTAESITDAELSDFYEINKSNYWRETELKFTQLFINPERHPQGLTLRISAVKKSLAAGADPASLSDPSLLPVLHEMTPLSRLESTFGKQFAQSLSTSEDSVWVGPLESAFGLHLVRIDSRREPRTPALAEISDQLRNDLLAQRREEALETLYRRLQATRTVTVESVNGKPVDDPKDEIL